jgi:hypothetical protein
MIMTFESTPYLLQQIGAILLSVLLIYQIHQWVRNSNVKDEALQVMLRNAKDVRNQAWNQSLELLSTMDESYNQLRKSTSNQAGWCGNKNPEMSVKYAVKMSNPIKESEAMPVALTLKQDEKRVSNRVLAMDMDG